ncbi:3'-5' exonuclease [Shewanella sp. 4_MG-2023]|uniref:3'-5' exonuclease n=1 Tax=Shewanella sp. 4_MG-2023 TaxID=3062652 RepID=UPI0026E1B409|nr:3'-5' exonuclease [Shewanella sp. 4_MG-2023]MDO6679515.1 3'-5' exonuclease [Shewanella sp. 4_MG-2023]
MVKKIKLKNTVILDTETTGLGDEDEIVQIASIDGFTGKILLNEKLKPIKSISKSASNIHGITNEEVKDCITYQSIHEKVVKLTAGKKVLIYNAEFDQRITYQTAVLHDCNSEKIEKWDMFCVMEWYSEYYDCWNDYFDNYTWQKLTSAARQQRIDISDLSAHEAWSDCEITRRLIHAVNLELTLK